MPYIYQLIEPSQQSFEVCIIVILNLQINSLKQRKIKRLIKCDNNSIYLIGLLQLYMKYFKQALGLSNIQ